MLREIGLQQQMQEPEGKSTQPDIKISKEQASIIAGTTNNRIFNQFQQFIAGKATKKIPFIGEVNMGGLTDKDEKALKSVNEYLHYIHNDITQSFENLYPYGATTQETEAFFKEKYSALETQNGFREKIYGYAVASGKDATKLKKTREDLQLDDNGIALADNTKGKKESDFSKNMTEFFSTDFYTESLSVTSTGVNTLIAKSAQDNLNLLKYQEAELARLAEFAKKEAEAKKKGTTLTVDTPPPPPQSSLVAEAKQSEQIIVATDEERNKKDEGLLGGLFQNPIIAKIFEFIMQIFGGGLFGNKEKDGGTQTQTNGTNTTATDNTPPLQQTPAIDMGQELKLKGMDDVAKLGGFGWGSSNNYSSVSPANNFAASTGVNGAAIYTDPTVAVKK